MSIVPVSRYRDSLSPSSYLGRVLVNCAILQLQPDGILASCRTLASFQGQTPTGMHSTKYRSLCSRMLARCKGVVQTLIIRSCVEAHCKS